jgi:hypothetical protein
MTVGSRRSQWALVVCGVLVAGQALFVSAPVSTTAAIAGSTCETLRVWAQAYQGTSPALDDVAHFDRAHRVAVFNAIAPEARAALWQEQLRRFDRQPGLSTAQHAFIAEARELTTPAFYRKDAAAVAAFEHFWSRADRAFTDREQRRAMFDIGSVAIDTRITRQSLQSSSAWDKLTGAFQASAGTATCECSITYQDCSSGCGGGGSCSSTTGCGPLGNSTCNGVCGGTR